MDIEDVKRLALAPGDSLVLRIRGELRRDELALLQGEMRQAFPTHRTLVVDESVELMVVPAKPEIVA